MISKAHHEANIALITPSEFVWRSPDSLKAMRLWLHLFHRDVAIRQAKARILFNAQLFDLCQLFDGADLATRTELASWLRTLSSDYAAGLADSLLSTRKRNRSAERVQA